jgi:hypothetical protein
MIIKGGSGRWRTLSMHGSRTLEIRFNSNFSAALLVLVRRCPPALMVLPTLQYKQTQLNLLLRSSGGDGKEIHAMKMFFYRTGFQNFVKISLKR